MLLKLGLFALGALLGGVVVVTVARRLPVVSAPRIAPGRGAVGLAPGPEPLLRLAPPSREPGDEGEMVATGVELSQVLAEVVIRDRTKSGEIIELRGLRGWEADLRDRGHRRGFTVRIRRTGEAEPLEVIQANGLLRAGAREVAIAALWARRDRGTGS